MSWNPYENLPPAANRDWLTVFQLPATRRS